MITNRARAKAIPTRRAPAGGVRHGDAVEAPAEAVGPDELAGDHRGPSEPEFETLYPALRRFAAVCADTGTDPDDLVQDALVAFLRRRPGHVRNPEAYLRRSVLNASLNRRRQRKAHPTVGLADLEAPEQPDELPSDTITLLQALTPNERAVLYLVDVEGHSAAEAADVLSISAVAVRARVSRARRAARKVLQSLEEESDG